MSLEELFGRIKPVARSKRGPASKLEQQLFVSPMLDTALAQH